MLYIRTHILHIKYIRIYIYKVKETKKKKKKKTPLNYQRIARDVFTQME